MSQFRPALLVSAAAAVLLAGCSGDTTAPVGPTIAGGPTSGGPTIAGGPSPSLSPSSTDTRTPPPAPK